MSIVQQQQQAEVTPLRPPSPAQPRKRQRDGGSDEQKEAVIDPILVETKHRFIAFPIEFKKAWKFYKKAQANLWTADETDLAQDIKDWVILTKDEKHFILMVLAFFAASDGGVMENLAARFLAEVKVAEVRSFYALQIYIESVHAEQYGKLIEAYVPEDEERLKLFQAVDTIPCIARKVAWAEKWIGSDRPFGQRLAAFAVVEGIFFSASFCAIFYFKKRGLLGGLGFTNELIARDEAMHTLFATLIHNDTNLVRSQPSREVLLEMVTDAVHIEKDFAREALLVGIIGMNYDEMSKYIEFTADRLLFDLKQEKFWHTQNPFPWMEMMSLKGITNFFEKRVSQYAKNIRTKKFKSVRDNTDDAFDLNAKF